MFLDFRSGHFNLFIPIETSHREISHSGDFAVHRRLQSHLFIAIKIDVAESQTN